MHKSKGWSWNHSGAKFGFLILGFINNGLNLFVIDPLWRDADKEAVTLFAILMDQWERKV